ncbi:MAG: acyl-CoA thioesterase [Actinomycetota bacterium]|jgi:acyl-CoA thioesterase-2|nr:acyl-CoA thioesterase [Actinomycetota bacterium]
MGDLGLDTAVERAGDDRFTATLSREWEIWGPMGGYVASVALRAAGAVSPFARPASFFCHYLSVASFDEPVTMAVSELRGARTAAAHRVEMTQGERRILEATVWSVGEGLDGLVHDESSSPAVPPPESLRPLTELLSEEQLAAGPAFPFWNNLETRPLDFRRDWPPSAPMAPVWQEWCRFTPTPTFDDPWVDACRALILVDVQSWPAASKPHAYKQEPIIAPSLDLYVAFHDPQPSSEWLLCDGVGPVARDGLMAWNGRLWSADGRLVASGTGQLLCRRMAPRA